MELYLDIVNVVEVECLVCIFFIVGVIINLSIIVVSKEFIWEVLLCL